MGDHIKWAAWNPIQAKTSGSKHGASIRPDFAALVLVLHDKHLAKMMIMSIFNETPKQHETMVQLYNEHMEKRRNERLNILRTKIQPMKFCK